MTLVKSNTSPAPSVWSDFFDNDKFFSDRWIAKELNQSLPAVNIKESGNGFSIDFAAPGYKKSDFKINVKGNVLSVNAEKQDESKEENEKFTRQEFAYASFSRSFTLPQAVNADKIEAKYTDGILKLSIPKKEEAKAQSKKEITVA